MAAELKHRFGKELPISRVDAVKELILIKKTAFRSIGQDDNWPYPYPFIVYEQMKLSKDSVTFRYFLEMLTEFQLILNQSEQDGWELAEKDGLWMKSENRDYLSRHRADFRPIVDAYLDSAKHLQNK
jgi:hypothetical protein